MGVERLRARLASARLVLLDTMVFAYHLADHPEYGPLTAELLGSVESGKIAGLATTLTLAELLTQPSRAGDPRAMQEYELFLTRFPNLELVPLDVDLARESARVRGETGLRTPDAIQVAAARLRNADAIVTNDLRWRGRVMSPELILLDDFLERNAD